MIILFRTPYWLWLLPLLAVLLWWLGRRSRMPRAALLLRSLITLLIVVALADPIRPGTAGPAPLLILADQSASLTEDVRNEAWQIATRIAEERGSAETTVAALGEEVVIAPDLKQPQIQADGTDIEAALQLAKGLQPSGGRVLLLSDGAATSPGVDEAAQALREQGVAVDVLPLADDIQADARIVDISLPAGLRAGQSFRGAVTIDSTAATTATLVISFNGQPVAEQALTLTEETLSIPLPGTVPDEGLQRFRAELRIDDAHAENNSLDTTVLVGPPPRVLVVEHRPDSAAQLRDMLEAQGVQSEALRPADVSSSLSDLRRFDAIVLQDIPASALSLDQQSALREYVRSMGHGLLAIGGTSSYSLGGYKGTPLEEVLPVRMETPPRRERQQVALLLIIDRSASMYGATPTTNKLELAKGGAIAATQVLVPNDRVGVLSFDTETEWTVPFTRIGEGLALSEIQDRIAKLDFGGGTDIYKSLGVGLPELAEQDAVVRHAVLLTDGRSFTANPDAYDRLTEQARSYGITLSTIAIGDDADKELLERLADRGGGRYHFAADPQELPRLTLMETEIAREDPRVEGEFQPQPAGAHPIVRGFVPSQFPSLEGYVAVTPKPEAETVLQSPQEDPILTSWQYGLGRSLAWTSDSGEAWSGNWQSWGESALLWTQMLAYTFPDPSQGPLTVRIDRSGATPMIVADARGDDGTPLDLADVGARVEDPDGNESTVRLKQIAPGQYQAPLPAENNGAYTVGVALRKNDQQLEAQAGWAKPYAAEFALSPDRALLERIATISGGQVLTSADAAADAVKAETPRPTQAFWPWLIGLAVLLWPLEIAIRRGWLRLRR
ncbi:MAG: VWA domain-containing protein [Chloroflexi bacterium]|nr:VWA domain-containing protein [Chloroflexota bacterium]